MAWPWFLSHICECWRKAGGVEPRATVAGASRYKCQFPLWKTLLFTYYYSYFKFINCCAVMVFLPFWPSPIGAGHLGEYSLFGHRQRKTVGRCFLHSRWREFLACDWLFLARQRKTVGRCFLHSRWREFLACDWFLLARQRKSEGSGFVHSQWNKSLLSDWFAMVSSQLQSVILCVVCQQQENIVFFLTSVFICERVYRQADCVLYEFRSFGSGRKLVCSQIGCRNICGYVSPITIC